MTDVIGASEVRIETDVTPFERSMARIRTLARSAGQGIRESLAIPVINTSVDVDTRAATRQIDQFAQDASDRVSQVDTSVDVDTSDATRQIDRFVRDAAGRLRDARGRFVTAVEVDTSDALQQIDQFTRDASGRLRDAQGRFVTASQGIGDGIGDGVEEGSGRARRALSGLAGAFGRAAASAGEMASRVSGPAVAALAAAAASAGAAIAVTTGLGVAFAGLGVKALAETEPVKEAFADLSTTLKAVLQAAAQPLQVPLISALSEIEDAAVKIGPDLQRLFAASVPFLEALTDGLVGLVRGVLPGFEAALARSAPVAEALKNAMITLGEAVGEAVEALSQDPQGTADAIGALADIVATTLPALANLASVVGKLAVPALELMGTAVSAIAFVINDLLVPAVNAVTALVSGDLDGALKALSGETETTTQATEGFTEALGLARTNIEATAAAEEDAAEVKGLYASAVLRVNEKLEQQRADADSLRNSLFALTAVTRGALDAQSGYEAAVDRVNDLIKDQGDVLDFTNGHLDLNKGRSREAYDALSQLARQTEEYAASVLESTDSVEQSNAVLDRGRRKLIEQADALGGTTEEAKALANQLIATPDRTVKVRGDISHLATKISEYQKRLREAIGNKTVKIKGDISDLLRKINQAAAALARLVGATVKAGVGRVSGKLANGGIVTSPTTALIGEAGPEVVIPLNRPRRASELMAMTGLDSFITREARASETGSIVVQAPAPIVTTTVMLDSTVIRTVVRQELSAVAREITQGVRV